jgi:hypothetical protein
MTGIASPLHPPDARPSYMSHRPTMDPGAAAALTRGMLAHRWTTTAVAIILYLQRAHIASQARPNYFHNTVKSHASQQGSTYKG